MKIRNGPAAVTGNEYGIPISRTIRYVFLLPIPVIKRDTIMSKHEKLYGIGVSPGDPLTYSTFGYVLKSLKTVMPEADIETIPGITSFHTASAKMYRTRPEHCIDEGL